MTTTDRAAIVLQQIDDRISAISGNWPDESRALRCLKTAIEGHIEVIGCFDAAITEGLNDRIGELSRDVGSLNDLVTRRLLFAYDAAVSALTTLCDQWDAGK